MNKVIAGSVFALISTIFISSYSTFSKILLEYFPPYSLAALAQTFSVITLLIFFGALPEFKNLSKLTNRQMKALMVVAILSAIVQPLFLFQGLLKSSAINGVLISRTQMVMVGVFSALWLRERVTGSQIIGTIIMLGGAYFIATKGLTARIMFGGGDSLLFASAFFGAFSTTVFKRYLATISPHLVVLFRNTVGMLLNLTIVPALFGFQHSFGNVFQPRIFIIAALFSLVVIVGAQYLWYKSVEMIPASRASAIGMTSPMYGVLFAMAIIGEQLSYFHIVGAVLIILGVIFSTVHHQTHKEHKKHLLARHWSH